MLRGFPKNRLTSSRSVEASNMKSTKHILYSKIISISQKCTYIHGTHTRTHTVLHEFSLDIQVFSMFNSKELHKADNIKTERV